MAEDGGMNGSANDCGGVLIETVGEHAVAPEEADQERIVVLIRLRDVVSEDWVEGSAARDAD